MYEVIDFESETSSKFTVNVIWLNEKQNTFLHDTKFYYTRC